MLHAQATALPLHRSALTRLDPVGRDADQISGQLLGVIYTSADALPDSLQ